MNPLRMALINIRYKTLTRKCVCIILVKSEVGVLVGQLTALSCDLYEIKSRCLSLSLLSLSIKEAFHFFRASCGCHLLMSSLFLCIPFISST